MGLPAWHQTGHGSVMLTTRCSTCHTSFRVNEQQLAAKDGWVRCGRCLTVFDARSALADPEIGEPHADAPESASGERIDAALDREPKALAEPQAIQQAEFQNARLQGQQSEDRLERRTEPEGVPDAKTGEPEPPAPMYPESAPVATPIRQDAPELLDFGPRPYKSRTALWALGSAVLLLAFGAQAAFQYRGTIALLLPEAKPYLEQFCAELGCELPLPRRAELMSIETSDLQGHPNNPAVMVLAATLRNRAPFPQAYPALELTLTDDRDQPLARRVLQPADYLAQGAARADGGAFAASSEQPVRVFLEASSLKATSYRLYLFHP